MATHVPLTAELYYPPYNVIRRAKFILFGSIFLQHPKFSDLGYLEKIDLLKKVERSCYNYTIDKLIEENIMASWETDIFCDMYHSICYKVSSNLGSPLLTDNTNLLNMVMDNKIVINDLPRLSSQDLCPEKYVQIRKRIEASKNATTAIKTSSMYTCRHCKKSQCTIENRYNRSLDEGVNLTITCLNCWHSWNA